MNANLKITPYNRAYSLLQEMYNNFNREEKTWFIVECPVNMHSTVGMHLRNHANLWQDTWEPDLLGGVDISPHHPDAVSNKVIEDFQKSIIKKIRSVEC